MTTKKKTQDKVIDAVSDFEEFAAQNIIEMASTVRSNTETLDLITSKITSLACHVTALEAILSEVIKTTGVDLVQVNTFIRSRIKSVDGDPASYNVVVDIAAALASPSAKRPL